MGQAIVHVALVVREYDEAVDFFVGKLGFRLLDDTFQPEENKRWVVVSPPGSCGTSLLLARVSGVRFVREPSEEAFGTVAVFEDLYGNRWDLVQYTDSTAGSAESA